MNLNNGIWEGCINEDETNDFLWILFTSQRLGRKLSVEVRWCPGYRVGGSRRDWIVNVAL